MSMSISLIIFGLLCVFTPAILIWLQRGKLDEHETVQWMTSQSMENMQRIWLMGKIGGIAILAGFGLLFSGM